MRKTVLALALTMALGAHAKPAPKGGPRISTIQCLPGTVVEIVGRHRHSTLIEVPEGALIAACGLGDTTEWMVEPPCDKLPAETRRLTVAPRQMGSETNLVLETDGGNACYLDLYTSTSSRDGDAVIRLDMPLDRKPTLGKITPALPPAAPAKPVVQVRNRGYEKSGDALGLKDIWDDGQFTTFVFDKEAELPAIYVVASDKSEALANVRSEIGEDGAKRLIVERRAPRFTLRAGKSRLCVKAPELAS